MSRKTDLEKYDICVKILDEIKIDPRLQPVIFDVCNDSHLSLYREYLVKEGFTYEETVSISNKLAEAGKHPERQAYNADGLLVTFPTPAYKQNAIQRGTHFEKNPKDAEINLFTPEPAAAQAPVAASTPAPEEKPEKKEEPVADPRTPEDRAVDSKAIEKMLKTESDKKLYTVEEAVKYGFFNRRGNIWYDADGNLVGKAWKIDAPGEYILPI